MLLQEKDTKIESLSAQIADLKKSLEEKEQLEKDLSDERASISQLKELHFVEATKQKTKLDEACKHYQTTLIDEQSKFQLTYQQLETAKSDMNEMKLVAIKSADALEAQKAIVMELQDDVSRLQKDLADSESEKQRLENSYNETSHLLSIAQQSAPKNRTNDLDFLPQPLISAQKISASSAGAASDKMKSVLMKKSVQHVNSFNPSASPPSALKYRESPKTKKRDKAKVISATW
jgi:chromosome segregation ATPase